MRITDNHLLHLPVYTQSGQWLGRIARFSVDVEEQLITEYTVTQFPYIHALAPERTIPRTAVISITAEKMVVDDGMAKVAEPSVLSQTIPTTTSIEG